MPRGLTPPQAIHRPGIVTGEAIMGANAVVGVDIDYEKVGANASMLMVTVSGTAVVLQ